MTIKSVIMDKLKTSKKTVKRRRAEKENAKPDSLNNSLWDNLLGDNINDLVGRRSDVGKRSLMLEIDESITDVDVNNDELEKEERRREEERERAEREKAAAALAKNQAGLTLLGNLSQDQLDQHYSKCIEMCNKNKVNVKNAFKLQLIDYMKLIVSNRSTKSENLTLMSCTLGASAKIYAHRVDKVYADMTKIISGKGGEIEKDDDSTEDGNNNDDEDDELEEKVKLKKRRFEEAGSDDEADEEKDSKYDMEKMLLTEAQLNKAKGEEALQEKTNLPRGLEYFLECPQLDPDGRFQLNPPIFPNFQLEKPPDIPYISVNEVLCSDQFIPLELCDYIKDYRNIRKSFSVLGEGDDTCENSALLNSSLAFDPSSNIDIPDLIRNDAEERDLYESEGVAPESWAPDYDDEFDSDREEVCERSGQVSLGQRQSFDPKAMAKLVSVNAGDYSFFDNRIDFLDGPRHWTIKRSRGYKGLEKSQKPGVESTKKTFKKSYIIEFSTEKLEEVKKWYCDVDSARLARKTIINWSVRKLKIPREVSYTQKNLLSLMKNENLLFVKKDSNTHIICTSDLCNEEDALLSPDDFEGDIGQEDDDDDIHHMDERDSTSFLSERPPTPPMSLAPDGQSLNDSNCELVPAPQRVTRINLKFAKAQKRIDVKLLKNVIWTSLSLDTKKKEERVSFSKVFSSLPEKLPPEEAAQLSFPIAFMALLHMANEKNLHLQGSQNDISVALG